MIFADTSGFVAAFDARDSSHSAVAEVWRKLAVDGERLLTTQLVFAETVTHLRRRAGWEPSQRVGEALLGSEAIEIAPLSPEELRAAWRELLRNADPKLSLCDAASFVVMRSRGIKRVLTLDRHFADGGFDLLP